LNIPKKILTDFADSSPKRERFVPRIWLCFYRIIQVGRSKL